tara:strand:- start:71 stop:550 length:480 start_codon:yes stop_codon:yes gene_type:complete
MSTHALPDDRTYFPSRAKWAGVFIIAALLLIAVLALPTPVVLKLLIGAVFGLAMLGSALQIFLQMSWLKLTPDRLEYSHLGHKQSFSWLDVSEFQTEAMTVSFITVGDRILFSFHPPGDPSAGRTQTYLPEMYGQKPKELEDMLNAFRARALETLKATR